MAEVFQLKVLKPKRLNIDAIRLELLNEVRKEGREAEKELAKTTTTWKGAKPKFTSLVSLAKGDVSVLTGPDGDAEGIKKWNWLNDGTRAHEIRARRKPYLRFRVGGFASKTRVGKFSSGPGRAASGPWRRPLRVRHPGIEARNWTGILQKRRKPKFTKRIISAMKRGVDKAGG